MHDAKSFLHLSLQMNPVEAIKLMLVNVLYQELSQEDRELFWTEYCLEAQRSGREALIAIHAVDLMLPVNMLITISANLKQHSLQGSLEL